MIKSINGIYKQVIIKPLKNNLSVFSWEASFALNMSISSWANPTRSEALSYTFSKPVKVNTSKTTDTHLIKAPAVSNAQIHVYSFQYLFLLYEMIMRPFKDRS